ncbi:hypothetical protein GW765_00295 [Candidatus Parcubacteria bacterium]|nr:hypothetical protein [Candidatus Parcubacteria bacterium]
MNKKVTNIILGLIGIGAIVLLVWGGGNSSVEENPIVSTSGTEVPCLPNGHQAVAQHIHPVISISVDGEEEFIPANVGIEGLCMREVHTHDATGTIHIETKEVNTTYTLPDFFAVLGAPMEREGYSMTATKDEEEVSPEELVFEDGSMVEVRYISI